MRRLRWILPAVFFAVTVYVALPLDAPLEVGTGKQLFLDTKFIQSSEGISLTMNPPARSGEILIAPDAPWEKDLRISSYSTVLRENGRTRLWYGVLGKNNEPGKNPDFMGIAYAESVDGIHFQKPRLGLVEFQGSRENNLVLPTDPKLLSLGGGAIWRDENPQCPPAARYKSWQKTYPKPGTGIRGPHRVWLSPDGLHWKLSEKLVTGLRAADTQPSWFWDPRISRYVGFSREWVRFTDGRPIRMSSYNESNDMHAWENMHISFEPDEADFSSAPLPIVDPSRMQIRRETWTPNAVPSRKTESKQAEAKQEIPFFDDPVPVPGAPLDIYGAGVFPYTEAGGIYISLMSVYHHWRTPASTSWPDTADVRLGVSRDARHFFRPGGRQPFLRLGPASSFDSKWVWALPRPVRMGDELWVYYMGGNRDHAGRTEPGAPEETTVISRATMRLDGFVSADFDYTGGSLITPPLQFQGSRLELNLDTSAGGLGRVELLDATGAPIPGFTLLDAGQLNGNSTHMPVSWKGSADISVLAGKTIRLHLKMRSAKLYAFQFQ